MRSLHSLSERGDEELGGARERSVFATGDVGLEGCRLLDWNRPEACGVSFSQRKFVDHRDAEIRRTRAQTVTPKRALIGTR
jgi:hypothetical protein